MTGPEATVSGHDNRSSARVGYGVMLAICLPRDTLSVPVIRHLVGDALMHLGVSDDTCSDITLALTEACTNVLDHSGPGDAYDVTVTIRPDRCELRIVDVGHGFDHAIVDVPAAANSDSTTERGRGLGLMRALVDHIQLTSEPEEGTLVHLVKQLTFDPDAATQRVLLAGSAEDRGEAVRPESARSRDEVAATPKR